MAAGRTPAEERYELTRNYLARSAIMTSEVGLLPNYLCPADFENLTQQNLNLFMYFRGFSDA